MRAVRFVAGGGVEVADVPEPEIGPGEALLRPRAVGICGSDLLAWYAAGKAGTVAGHEVAGEIAAVGEGVAAFHPGDRVVPHHHAPCLDCPACRRGRFVHCAAWRASRLDPGAMAELVRIPAGNLARDTQKIPAGLTDENASFAEPLATVVKAFRQGRFHHDDRLLVVGLGTAGQLAIRYAARLGASGIAGADGVASRRAMAETSGAAATIDVARESLAEGARRVTAGEGFDFVLVCPGKSEVIAEAFETVAPGGTLLLFTMPAPGDRLSFDGNALYFREVQVVPSYSCGPVEMKLALTLLAEGRVAVSDLVTHRFPAADAVEAFARAREPEGSVKVLVTFP
ncbi:MAG TPA: alcohol dehydrogenase catalytic domain-containing protein [Thermoanaerobaculia bacterium]|jgi:L-iditol 2-dehydrogenase